MIAAAKEKARLKAKENLAATKLYAQTRGKDLALAAADKARAQGSKAGLSLLDSLKKQTRYRMDQVKYSVVKRPEKEDPAPTVNKRKHRHHSKRTHNSISPMEHTTTTIPHPLEMLTPQDIVQPLEATSSMIINIINCRALSKADYGILGGSSDPIVVVTFMDKVIHQTKCVKTSLNPDFYPSFSPNCEAVLPSRGTKPLIVFSVYDVDAINNKLNNKGNSFGDFLGQVTLSGKDFLHPTDLLPIVVQDENGNDVTFMVKTFSLLPDKSKSHKYNKLVKGTLTLSIDRAQIEAHIISTSLAKEQQEQQRILYNNNLLNLEPPLPIVMNERATLPNGLWVPKRFGEIKPGDDRRKSPFIEGGVELRSLRDLYKLTFTDIRVIKRVKDVDSDSDDENSEDDDEFDMTAKKRNTRTKLRLYLTLKKPKNRMADVEETGHIISCDTPDGSIDTLLGTRKLTNFDVSLKDIPNANTYAGVVIVKQRNEHPITEEPIIYGFAKFSVGKQDLIGTEYALNMVGDKDRLLKITQGSNGIMDGLNSITYYGRKAKEAWALLNLTEEDVINYRQFQKALDLLNIIILEGRALRIFKSCDLDGSGFLKKTDFEVAVMMNDAVPKLSSDLSPLDAFYIFDSSGNGRINQSEFNEVVLSLNNTDKNEDEIYKVFVKASKGSYSSLNTGTIDYTTFKTVYCKYLCDPAVELKKRGLSISVVNKDSVLSKLNVKPLLRKQEEFKRFINSTALLKDIELEDAMMLQSFSTVLDKVKEVRIQAQKKKDDRHREKRALIALDSRSAARDTAVRNKEYRAQAQKEVKDRAKKRIEERELQSKLIAEQAEAKQRELKLISMSRVEKEAHRLKEIRRKGEDKLVLKDMNFRVVQADLYTSSEQQAKLSNLVILDLSGNKLTALPESNFLFNLNSLRSFNLSHNRITHLPVESANLGSLEVLLIDNNDLRTLPAQMEHMTSLLHLDCSRNKLEVIPEEIGFCVNMKYLVLHSNSIATIGNGIGKLSSLEVLNLSSNRLPELPEEFSELGALKKCDLSSNILTHLPDGFGMLYSLITLNLDVNNIQVLPDTMSGMTNLEILKINDNLLTELPECCKGWVSCMDLQIRNNKCQRISASIGYMVNLQNLDLRGNWIDGIPCEIGMLASLQVLNIRNNNITTRIRSLPSELGALVTLQMFDMSYNKVTELPREIGLQRSLRTLNVSYNAIASLPLSFGALVNLEVLDISHNCLALVPESMGYLKSLRVLDVSCNRVAVFPMHLCTLTSLTHLNLSSNTLHTLPPQIHKFTNLTNLDIHHNLLSTLPLEFAELLDHVDDLNIVQNPFTGLPWKWNLKWTEKEMYLNPSGYSNYEVFEWVREEALVYGCCRDEWEDTGALHFGCRLDLNEFLYGFKHHNAGTSESVSESEVEFECLGVKRRMSTNPIYDKHNTIIKNEDKWHNRFIEHTKRFYFLAKVDGCVPIYNDISSTLTEEREDLRIAGEKRRDKMALKSKTDVKDREVRMNEKYDVDVRSKIRRAEGQRIERKKRMANVGVATIDDLRMEVTRRSEMQEENCIAVVKHRNLEAKNEILRLQNYVREKTVLKDNIQLTLLEEEELKLMDLGLDAERPKQVVRTMPIYTVPCWKSKALTNESFEDSRKGAIAFKKKFSRTERNYDPLGGKGKVAEDKMKLARLK